MSRERTGAQANHLDVEAANQEDYVQTDLLEHPAAKAWIRQDNVILRMKDAEFEEVVDTNLEGVYP